MSVPSFAGLLSTFLRNNVGCLEQCYQWKLPTDIPIEFQRKFGESTACATMRLKRDLARHWRNGDDSRRLELANWYVSTWGGVKRNSSQRIRSYAEKAVGEIAAGDFKGIASWSKVLSIRDPDSYAIYDARVATSLNALQLLEGRKIVISWRIPPGRNAAINAIAPALQRRAASSGARDLRPEETYNHYLQSLTDACAGCCKLEEGEMTLFAMAEELARRVGHAHPG